MTPNPAVSIIIPTYNRKDLLPEAIDSALSQSYSDYEIIIVDHGSTDGTPDMLKSAYGNRVRLVELPNCPLPACARNAGIRAARGRYITFLDSDDRWLPRKLEIQIQAAVKNPRAGLIYSLAEKFENHSSIKSITMRYHYRPSGNAFYFLLFYNFIPTLTVMIRRDVLDNVGVFDVRPDFRAAEDYDLWLRVAKHYRIHYIPEVLAQYRVHAHNISSNIFVGFDLLERVLRKTFSEIKTPLFIQRKAFSHVEMGRFEYGVLLRERREDVLPHLQRAIQIDPLCLSAWLGLLLMRCVDFARLKRMATYFRNTLMTS